MAEPMVGEIRLLAGVDAPPGWACCDGQLLQIREHSTLFSVLGTAYGGDGRTTFALPDLRGKTPVHPDGGLIRLGSSGGETGHALTNSEIPGHAHGALGMIAPAPVAVGVTTVAASRPGVTATQMAPSRAITIDAAGQVTGESHDNMQPYLGLTFVIALHGVSPSRK